MGTMVAKGRRVVGGRGVTAEDLATAAPRMLERRGTPWTEWTSRGDCARQDATHGILNLLLDAPQRLMPFAVEWRH